MVRSLGLVLVAMAASGALAACGDAKKTLAVAPAVAEGPAFAVTEAMTPDYRMVAAILTNRDNGDARARIGGKLSRVLVREGDEVRPGQVVAQISDERIALEAQAGSASVAAAEADATRAREDLARSERLFAAGAIAPAAIETIRATAKSAEARLKAARAQAGAAQALNAQGEVTAPAKGKVTTIPVPQGAVVMAGDVVVGISTGVPVLRIEVPEAEAGNLIQGAHIRLLVGEDGEQVRAAAIRQVYPAVKDGRVTADLDAPDLPVDLIGARARVLVPAGERMAIVVPSSYLVTRYGADYVRLARAGGTVIEAPVQRGAPAPTDALPDGIEILSGLRAGDKILPPRSQP
ncbi:MAG: efflux RND transporter periplasmic adaptor subunit [Alphaproteobacteria bacterium]|nr:efflux RND transporter periplasmic adaptor subunit [Alphaproteobacteria bacterium]